jgi:hypothetical protein
MSADPFAVMMAAIFNNPDITTLGWLTRRSGARAQVRAILSVPERDDLVGQAAKSLDNRFIELPSALEAGTGDLITTGGVTYSLAQSPSPDILGLSKQWIGVPLTLSVGSIAYHADGYPLVSWNGREWVAA